MEMLTTRMSLSNTYGMKFGMMLSLKRMNSDVCAASIPGAVFCDAKNVYDCADSGLQLEERRLCLEIVSIQERKEAINSPLRWVDSDQQYADDRTEVFAVDKLLEILRKKTVCVMFDPSFISAQKKRQIKSQEKKNEQVQPEINYTQELEKIFIGESPCDV